MCLIECVSSPLTKAFFSCWFFCHTGDFSHCWPLPLILLCAFKFFNLQMRQTWFRPLDGRNIYHTHALICPSPWNLTLHPLKTQTTPGFQHTLQPRTWMPVFTATLPLPAECNSSLKVQPSHPTGKVTNHAEWDVCRNRTIGMCQGQGPQKKIEYSRQVKSGEGGHFKWVSTKAIRGEEVILSSKRQVGF